LIIRRFADPTHALTRRIVEPVRHVSPQIVIAWPVSLRWPQHPFGRDPVAAALVFHHALCR
jgi:hypothetical protein